MAVEVFKTLKEVHDKYFPNRPVEELERPPTPERIQEELHQFVEIARRNTKLKEVDSKKLPR